MRISEAYAADTFGLSFELFPPKSAAGESALMRNVEQLCKLRPSFITCTYGAGGSTREKTLGICRQVNHRFGVPVASHLTCVGSTVDQLRDYLADAESKSIHNIVALRGDPPQGESAFRQVEGGLRYANELVSLIRDEFPQFGVAVAGYPEKHQEAASLEIDLENLKRKVICGADVVITQLFYRNEDFFRFRDRAVALGIDVPLVPGILPVTTLAQIRRITSLCGAQLPDDFVQRLGQHDDSDWQFQVGVEQAVEQVSQLVAGGIPGIHFYVLNKSEATQRVLSSVQLVRG